MKYLKKFNESFKFKNLQEIIETHLIDLIDKGATVKCVEDGGKTWICNDITITLPDIETMHWKNIKDSIVPLVQILESDFNIKQINIYTWSGDYAVHSGYDCDNSKQLDEIGDDLLFDINRVEIYIIENI